MAKISKAAIEKEAAWLKSYAKKKPINNYGGNCWGFNRNRCTIVQPEMIQALVDNGFAVRMGLSFVMV